MLVFETPRLILKDVSEQDIAVIHELHSLPETDEFNTLGIPAHIGITRNIVGEWLTQQQANPRTVFILAITLRETGQFIGLIALKLGSPRSKSAEVWYKLHKDHWRHGYTTEALYRLLHFGFDELRLHRIEAGCAVENTGSIKVLEKAGMQREGRSRKILPIRGNWIDNYVYAILEEDFFAQKNSHP